MILSAVGIQFLLGIALIILGFFLVLAVRKWLPPQAFSIILLVGGSLALTFTWYLLFRYMALTAGRILAPWDLWGAVGPPKAPWQRQLNDVFSRSYIQRLFALAVVGISIGFFLAGIRRAADSSVQSRLPLAFAGTNLAFLLISFLVIAPLGHLPDLWLPQPRPPVDVGYHRTWPDGLVTGVLLGLLFWVQSRITTSSFWKRALTYSAPVADGDG